MIKYYEILGQLADQLTSSPALSGAFASSPFIQIGEDGINPVGEKDVAYIVLQPSMQGADYGFESGNFAITFELDFGLVCDSVTTSGHVKTFGAIERIDDIAEVLISEVKSCFDTAIISKCDYAVDATSFYPLAMGGMTIQLSFLGSVNQEIGL